MNPVRTRIPLPATVLAALFTAAAAVAGPKDVAMHLTRLGGNSVLAQPYVESFLRYIEAATGWTPASMNGTFHVSKKGAIAYVARAQPGIGIMEPALYFEYRQAWQLQLILQAESKDLVADQLHVVVKDPAVKGLADLKGRRLWTTLADYPRYLSKVVLGGQVDAAGYFVLDQVHQALTGARGVLRGDCDAAILDDDQFARAKEMEGGENLRTIFDSPALPPLPVVVFGDALTAAERQVIAKALIEMSGNARGSAICRRMHIGRFAELNSALFSEIQQRYGE
jgi:ABC-type phosphate/phosphonate transport system substrate-binding protein